MISGRKEVDMVHRIAPILAIYICAAGTWLFLAKSVDDRTREYDSKLRGAVGQLWGANQKQEAPVIYADSNTGNEKPSIQASDLAVDLDLEHRQKGLLWYSTYRVKFGAVYKIINASNSPKSCTFTFKFPSEKAIYDDVKFVVDGRPIQDLPIRDGKLTKELSLASNQTELIEVGYVTNGMDEWWYDFGSSVSQVKNFSLTMNTDFDQIDFPESSIAPTKKDKTAAGWKLQWRYANLLSSVKIGMVMPQKLNPGPWVSQVSSAAPVSLFLFFFLLFVITTVRQIRIHPMNYFFIAASFFSFHLLLAYLVDHISVHVSFIIASLVSVALVVSYMRLVVGQRFAFLEVGVSQFIFLVLFSYSFFFKGYTGLAITALSIATLFVTMQITARLDWDSVFRKNSGAPDEIKLEI